MSSKQLFEDTWKGLIPLYEEREAKAIAQRLFVELFGLKMIDISSDKQLSNDLIWYNEVFALLKEGMPFQYALGYEWFDNLKFELNKNTLIPRPETEELVLWIAEDLIEEGKTRIVDVGTGSGCIIISLAVRNLAKNYIGIDISSEAIGAARKNALSNQVDVEFIEMDICSKGVNIPETDVVVSNPPYVLHKEMKTMAKHVLDYEPSLALFVSDDDPLLFYRIIAEKSKQAFKGRGVVYYEIHHLYGQETKTLLEHLGYHHVELRKDIHGKDRMVKAIWN